MTHSHRRLDGGADRALANSSGFFSTAVAALDAFSSPAVREILRHSEIDFRRFLDGGLTTIDVSAPITSKPGCAPCSRPSWPADRHGLHGGLGRSATEALVVAIDTPANIAPLEDLPSIASTARSHGIQLVTIWHHLAQVEERYRSSSRTLFNNHLVKVVLSGCSGLTTLHYVASCWEKAWCRSARPIVMPWTSPARQMRRRTRHWQP